MKIWCFADSHGLHSKLKVPENIDMAIFAGDAGTYKNPYINQAGVLDFIEWFESLKIKNKIWIAGSHDTSIEYGLINPKELCKTSVYLEHESKEIGGIKIFGSPWTPWFYDWAFNIPPDSEEDKWQEIPRDTDIIVTHGPCRGILDVVSFDNKHVGDEKLLQKVQEIKPHYHISGHIHQNSGIIQGNPTTFVNAAVVDDKYKLVNNGIIIEI